MRLNRHVPMPEWEEGMWALTHPGVPPLPRMIHGVAAYERRLAYEHRLAREPGFNRMYRGMGRGPLPRP